MVAFQPDKARKAPRYMGLIAACLVLLAGTFAAGIYSTNFAAASTVSFDVNPSIQLRVTEKEKVLSVTPLNKDGEIVRSEERRVGKECRLEGKAGVRACP